MSCLPGMDLEREASINFRQFQQTARLILMTKGPGIYEWWLSKIYVYPLEPWMRAYQLGYDRSPLSLAEEQELVDARDRKLKLPRQSRLDNFFAKNSGSRKRPRKLAWENAAVKQRKRGEESSAPVKGMK